MSLRIGKMRPESTLLSQFPFDLFAELL